MIINISHDQYDDKILVGVKYTKKEDEPLSEADLYFRNNFNKTIRESSFRLMKKEDFFIAIVEYKI